MKLRFILSLPMLVIAGLAVTAAEPAAAADGGPAVSLFDEDRALGTTGLSTLDGTSGGGVATWATIGGYGSSKGIGTAFHYTYANVSDYQLQNTGVILGLFNRVELSYDHDFFQTGGTGLKLGIGRGYTFDLDQVGVKLRLFGDLADGSLLPQIAIGAQYKHTNDGRILHAIGAASNTGGDFYIAATKLFTQAHILLDTTLRFTKANQWGILGFGGELNNSYHAEFEGSIGYLPPFVPGLVVGAEYRTKPRNLSYTDESGWFDAYASYFFNKHLDVTLAYVSLGTVATYKDQRGVYASVQTGF